MGAICMMEHSEKLQNLVNDALGKGAETDVRVSFGNLGEDTVDQFFPPTVVVNFNYKEKIMQDEVSWIRYLISFSTSDTTVSLSIVG
jgi:acyl-CoA reductase-like NAD-dependent aldehyde dehydrogenase